MHEFVTLALGSLESFRYPSGLYCFDRASDSADLRGGEDIQISLQILIGLQRASAAGYDVDVDLDALADLCCSYRAELGHGDLGLALWADARAGGRYGPDLVARARSLGTGPDALDRLIGMDIAWLVLGLSHQVHHGGDDGDLLATTLAALRRRRTASGLFVHHASPGPRRRFPNFATQIYAVLALATVANHGIDADAAHDAAALANRLLQLQLSDGAWPWLYDATRGVVIERYEIYAVHQDAMAPMALLELTDATGDPRYRDAAIAGLSWSFGDNELGEELIDFDGAFARRSIRRRWPWSRVAIAANLATAVVAGRPLWPTSRTPEMNRTCRPYHLGWMLEAWAGRELERADDEQADVAG